MQIDQLPNNFELMTLLARMVVPKTKNPPDYTKIRRALYCAKIIDLFWFDSDLPENETVLVDYYLNINWSGLSSTSEDLEDILNLDEPGLRLLCRRIQKPNWLTRGFRKNSLGLDEIPQLWENG